MRLWWDPYISINGFIGRGRQTMLFCDALHLTEVQHGGAHQLLSRCLCLPHALPWASQSPEPRAKETHVPWSSTWSHMFCYSNRKQTVLASRFIAFSRLDLLYNWNVRFKINANKKKKKTTMNLSQPPKLFLLLTTVEGSVLAMELVRGSPCLLSMHSGIHPTCCPGL